MISSVLVLRRDEGALLTSVELALTDGVPTKTNPLNLSHRLIDRKMVCGPPLDKPQAMALHREPKANVDCYAGRSHVDASQVARRTRRSEPGRPFGQYGSARMRSGL